MAWVNCPRCSKPRAERRADSAQLLALRGPDSSRPPRVDGEGAGGAEGAGDPGFDEGVETPGPLVLVASGENTSTGGRLVVFGTSQFAADQYFDSYGNGDLFANSVDWAAEQENLTNITPKQTITRTFLPASQGRILFLMFISACAIPGIFLALGIYTWVLRRRQG